MFRNKVTTDACSESMPASQLKVGQLAYVAGTDEIVMRVYNKDEKQEFYFPYLIRLKDGDIYTQAGLRVIPMKSGNEVKIIAG